MTTDAAHSQGRSELHDAKKSAWAKLVTRNAQPPRHPTQHQTRQAHAARARRVLRGRPCEGGWIVLWMKQTGSHGEHARKMLQPAGPDCAAAASAAQQPHTERRARHTPVSANSSVSSSSTDSQGARRAATARPAAQWLALPPRQHRRRGRQDDGVVMARQNRGRRKVQQGGATRRRRSATRRGWYRQKVMMARTHTHGRTTSEPVGSKSVQVRRPLHPWSLQMAVANCCSKCRRPGQLARVHVPPFKCRLVGSPPGFMLF